MSRLRDIRADRRAARRERKRARILAAAHALLRARGYERLSLRDAARRARCSAAGVYEFFDAKDDLIAALAVRVNASLARALAAAGRGAAMPQERLVRLGLAYVRFARRHPEDFQLLFVRRSARRSLAQDVPAASPYGLIRAAVTQAVGASRLRGADPRLAEALAYGFWATAHGMAMLQLTLLAGFRADLEAASRVVFESMAEAWRRTSWRKLAEEA